MTSTSSSDLLIFQCENPRHEKKKNLREPQPPEKAPATLESTLYEAHKNEHLITSMSGAHFDMLSSQQDTASLKLPTTFQGNNVAGFKNVRYGTTSFETSTTGVVGRVYLTSRVPFYSRSRTFDPQNVESSVKISPPLPKFESSNRVMNK